MTAVHWDINCHGRVQLQVRQFLWIAAIDLGLGLDQANFEANSSSSTPPSVFCFKLVYVWVVGPLWIEQGSTLHQLARKVSRSLSVKRHYAKFVVVDTYADNSGEMET